MIKKLTKCLGLLSVILFNCSFTNYYTVGITIYSFTESYNYITSESNTIGHSFITLTNNYSWPLELPYYTVGPFSTVSLGLWSGINTSSSSSGSFGSSNTEGYSGIYFNREAYIFSHQEDMIDCYQYSFEYNGGDFLSNKTLDFFKTYNDTYNLFNFNCACFVIDLLKCFTDIDLYSGMIGVATPGGLKTNMKKVFKDAVIESNIMSFKTNEFQKYDGNENKMRYFNKDGEY